MDRIALSKRIGGLADVFANDSQMKSELLAMSRALELMPDEKFATILNEGFDADEPMASQESDASVRGYGVAKTPPKAQPYSLGRQHAEPSFEPRDPAEGWARMKSDPASQLQTLLSDPKVQQAVKANPQLAQMVKSASEEEEDVSDEAAPETGGTANSWSREATDAVIRNLVGDVLGKEAMDKVQCCDTNAHLTKEQTPDGEKKAEKPSTLKPEQTPEVDESLDTDMYSKSKGEVRKEASKDAAEETKSEDVAEEEVIEEPAPKPKEDEAEVSKAQEQRKERKEEKAEEKEEEATKGAEQAAEALKELGKMKKEASDQSETLTEFAGIELTAPMADVELTENDVDTLGKLFK